MPIGTHTVPWRRIAWTQPWTCPAAVDVRDGVRGSGRAQVELAISRPALLGSPFGIVSALFLVVVWWCRELLTVTSRHTRRGSLMRHVHAGPAPAAQPPGRLTSRNASLLLSTCASRDLGQNIDNYSKSEVARTPAGAYCASHPHLFCPILLACSRHCAFFQSPCWVRIWRTLSSGRNLSASASHGLYPTALSAASSSAVKIASIAFLSFVNTGQPGRMNG